MISRLFGCMFTFLLAAGAPACGGGGSLSLGGGIGGTGIVVGVITGFGSVEVEGIVFDTSAASITIDGSTAGEADLDFGMLVKVTGTVDEDGTSGVAEAVELESLVAGPIVTVLPDASGATIVQDTVLVDDDTVTSGIDLASARPGDLVAVSGLVTADGTIRATHIRRVAIDTPFLVTGVLEDVDLAAEKLRIRGLRIDFSGATEINAPAGGLQPGQFARVVLRAAPAEGTAEALAVVAREIEVIDREDEKVFVRGLVTRILDARTFLLNRAIPVRVVDGTKFVNGSAGDIALDTLIGVVGRVTRDRQLVAARIAFANDELAGSSP